MNRIAQRYLALKAKKMKREVRVSNLASMKTALLVYDASNAEVEKKVRNYARFLKEEGAKVDTIAFYKLKGKEDQRPDDELSYFYFDKKNINWFGFPKDARILKCIAKPYDVLLDLNFERNFTLEIITTLSNSKFKIGKSGTYKKNNFDLSISIKDKNLEYFLEQVTTYLKMINNK